MIICTANSVSSFRNLSSFPFSLMPIALVLEKSSLNTDTAFVPATVLFPFRDQRSGVGRTHHSCHHVNMESAPEDAIIKESVKP